MSAFVETVAPIKPLTGVPLPPHIDPVNEHYPFCMVWTTIPMLSWFFPFIGHIAICDSQGKIYDFQGDYRIGCDRMLFGKVVRYWDLSPDYVPSFYSCTPREVPPELADQMRNEVRQYDEALSRATCHFRQTQHYNLFTNNCHAYVSAVVNENAIQARHLDTVKAAVGMFFNGKFVSPGRTIGAYLPFCLIVLCVILMCMFL